MQGVKPFVRFRDRVRDRAGAQDLLVVRVGVSGLPFPWSPWTNWSNRRTCNRARRSQNLLGLFTLGDALLPLYSPAAILGAESTGKQVALVMRGGQARVALAVDDADDVINVAGRRARRAAHRPADDIVLGVIWNDGDLLTLLDARAVVASYAALSTEGS
jgi:chemotaxis signal transduction protein